MQGACGSLKGKPTKAVLESVKACDTMSRLASAGGICKFIPGTSDVKRRAVGRTPDLNRDEFHERCGTCGGMQHL